MRLGFYSGECLELEYSDHSVKTVCPEISPEVIYVHEDFIINIAGDVSFEYSIVYGHCKFAFDIVF